MIFNTEITQSVWNNVNDDQFTDPGLQENGYQIFAWRCNKWSQWAVVLLVKDDKYYPCYFGDTPVIKNGILQRKYNRIIEPIEHNPGFKTVVKHCFKKLAGTMKIEVK